MKFNIKGQDPDVPVLQNDTKDKPLIKTIKGLDLYHFIIYIKKFGALLMKKGKTIFSYNETAG